MMIRNIVTSEKPHLAPGVVRPACRQDFEPILQKISVLTPSQLLFLFLR